jgi:hypothetical protein
VTQEEIHQAMRLMSRGFVNHPEVERLAGWLAERPCKCQALPVLDVPPVEIALVSEPAEPSIDAEVAEVRRTRRAKKAD